MLGVTFTSRAALEEDVVDRKKDKKDKKDKKKSKKDKKDKKEKKDKRKGQGSDSDGSSSDGDGAGPARGGSSGPDGKPGGDSKGGAEQQQKSGSEPPSIQREDWMTKPMKREGLTRTQQEAEEDRKQEEEDKKAAEPEIVAGLKIMKKPEPGSAAGAAAAAGGSAPAGAAAAAGGGAGSGRPAAGVVGDGGASWRLKALKRAQERAKAEGKSLHEVVGDRYGSVAQLTEDLSAMSAAHGKAHLRAAAERRRQHADPVPHYLQDVGSDRSKMMRPSDDTSLSWRRDRPDRERRDRDRDAAAEGAGAGGKGDTAPAGAAAAAAAGGAGGEHRERERERREGDRGGGGGSEPTETGRREGGGRGGGDRDRDRDRDRPREERAGGDRGGGGRGGGERRERGDREGDRGPADRRDRDREPRDREGDRDGDRRDRGRDWDRGRDREGGRGGGGGGGRGGGRDDGGAPRHSKEQTAALQQLAGALNQFRDDGSFMDRFMSVTQQRQQQQQQQGRGQQQQGPEQEQEEEEQGASPQRGDHDDHGRDDGDLRPGPSVRVKQEEGAEEGVEDGAGAGPGPSGAGGRGGIGSGGGGNRAIAAMLRGRGGSGAAVVAAAAATGGGGAGGGGAEEARRGQSGDEGAAEPRARRAPLFVGGPGGGGGGDDDEQGRQGGGGRRGGGSGVANKSAAELLRARLKGLPPPPAAVAAVAAAAVAGVVKREEGEDEHGGDGGGGGSRREVVQLPLVDASGRAVRGAFGREAAGAGTAPNAGKRAGQKAPQRYNKETGEKERYFADDDKVDLATMVRRAKYGDDDMQLDEHLAVNIAKKRKFRANDLDADAEYDYDGGIEMYENRSKRGNVEAQKSRDRNRQVADLRRQSQAEAGCMMCLSNPKRPAFLTVALGTCTYLSLPERGRLVRGHCCISPGEHLPSIRGLDEGAWTEVKNFIKCLIRMWGAQGQSVLFMETYMLRGGRRNHAVLEAFPVTERQLEKAKGYFKKALLEAESEWSTHHAKAVIDTTAQKGLRESIPPNFPYFYVQFGYGAGYVHVIDDESKFDPNFGRQVLVGLLDLPPELTHARQRAEAPAAQQQAVREFEALWDPYDWTRQIDA
ncbi:hypothetical protein CHLRE_17g741550v5 [Chlamydomonas reinhardtii]|uniref:Cwf19-like C-terminal domain-containing protein n=1 Tax=Chlamydomonas reinhardtii TaxID=3055 RepID=A0A2K3CRT7_CHLRE|nr:uncharacterized protein CHLRE_17g741550v5 [Chlamydomonas reinhardtii]PNW70985.1 hypothetical protein CHLRE_17g741550v5 [Chlamydomonas reinhardtii]